MHPEQIQAINGTAVKYPCFAFKREWHDYAKNLSIDESLSLYHAILLYGFNDIEPCLSKEVEAYFNNSIRADIDKQHAKIKRHK